MRAIERPAGCCPREGAPPAGTGAGDAPLLACLRAAADPTRLAVLRLLAAAKGPVCVCDITARFRLGQPTISHHLKVLRLAGLVTASRRGTWAHYALRPAGVRTLRRGVEGIAPARRRRGARR